MVKAPSSAGRQWLECLGDLTVINLPDRTDRRAGFERQLDSIGLSFSDRNVHLLPAERPSVAAGFPTIGAHGCFRSHLAVLASGMPEQSPGLILCEDDLDFSPDFNIRAPVILRELAAHRWDILYAGHNPRPEGDEVAPGLLRVAATTPVICAHFVIFRAHVLADIVPYLHAMMTRQPGDPLGGPMHVDGAYSHFRADHPQLITLAVDPPLGVQRASRTDIHALRWFDRMPVIRNGANLARRLIRR